MPCTISSSGYVQSSHTERCSLQPLARRSRQRWRQVRVERWRIWRGVTRVVVPLTSCKPRTRQVNIYNWADFIGSDTVAQFERQTGIKVVYDTYDSEETAETRLMAGGSDYDVVVSSSEFFSRSIKAGVYEPLDKRRLPNWNNLDPHALALLAQADPGNRHAIPYLHSINGFAYNVDQIRERMPDAPVDSLDMIFEPDVIARFADCGVTFLDSPADMLPLALNYLHLDPNSTRAGRLRSRRAIAQARASLRPHVRFQRLPERPRQCRAVHRRRLVERLRRVDGTGARSRHQGQSRLHGTEGRRQPQLFGLADPGGRAAPARGLRVPEFPAGTRR